MSCRPLPLDFHAASSDQHAPPSDMYHGYPAALPHSSTDSSRSLETAHRRQGGVSAPPRSPGESQPPRQPPSYGPHRTRYYSQPGLPDYRLPLYGAHEIQASGTHPPFHVQTGQEMMPGLLGGPALPAAHHYGPPPPSSALPAATPGSHYDGYNPGRPRHKALRAAQACDFCSQRRAKCDKPRPECQHCQNNGLKCSYNGIRPPNREKQVHRIAERLESVAATLTKLVAHSKKRVDISQQVWMAIDKELQRASERPGPSQAPPPHLGESSPISSARPVEQPVEAGRNDDDRVTFAMPLKHTTAVHHLFEWPSIKVLLPSGTSDAYVNDAEISRQLLHFYGSGDGDNKDDGHEGALSSPTSSSWEGRHGDETSSVTPFGVWGNSQLPLSPLSKGDHARQESPGRLSLLGGSMLHCAAVDAYFRSYMDNMHILHPFLEPRVLRQMVHDFKKKYSWDYPHHSSLVGAKRKWESADSPTPQDEMDTNPNYACSPARTIVHFGTVEHSVTNAIVLLVMGLGKVCTHRQPIPAPATRANVLTYAPHLSHSLFSDDPPPTKSVTTSLFSNHDRLSGANIVDISSPLHPQGKDMDVVPGLAYFAVAAEILGELPGGTDVTHAQANLLAGLYMGQLARVSPSLYYISAASRVCQILIESCAYKNKKMKSARRNLVNFAFWSCMQLESDILAEVDLPPSGITRFESAQRAEIPTGVTLGRIPESEGQENILRFYSYQIQLRRTMNEIHSVLYRENAGKQRDLILLMKVLDENIEEWRKTLNDWQWKDNDHQSENINVARMRAKYYGAKYIIHRPALYHVLQTASPPANTLGSKCSESPEATGTFPSQTQAGYSLSGEGRRPSGMGPALREPVDNRFITAARQCVEAAIRSTTAFDKVHRRMITTNIFGTAHAQFGNMLVLSAVYCSSSRDISSMVSGDVMRELFDRTIRILADNENISPVLRRDAEILQYMRGKVLQTRSAITGDRVDPFGAAPCSTH